MDDLALNYQSDFNAILQMIADARRKAAYQVNATMIDLYWGIGEFVSNKAVQDGWGRSCPKTKSDAERLFYLKLASREKYKAKELERQIDSGYYERLMLSDGKAPSAISQAAPANIIRDMYMLEFLDLPEPYREYDLKKAILKNMKKFLLEIGRDFIFMGEEYHLQVGKNDYYTDLIFFHRELQCLVAIELKIDDFKPEYLGKMQFYLEALDRDVKKPHENPSVGIILCKSKDEDVVEYALSRNMSPTMISEYRTKLISKEILQKKLEELTEMVDEDKNSQ